MKKLIKEDISLPFVVGETYVTKMQTKDRFTITKIITSIEKKTLGEVIQFFGIYESHPQTGECGLFADRLIPVKKLTGIEYEVNVCPKCNHEFKE